MTLVMVIMICVGCALILAGLATVGYRAVKLARAAKSAGFSSTEELQAVIRRSRDLAPRMEEVAAKQQLVAERLQSLSATIGDLNYLKDQLDQATGHLSKLKS